MKITYKDIAEFTNKSEAGIKSMRKNNPNQLELLKLGLLCKKLNLSELDLQNFAMIKGSLAPSQSPQTLPTPKE